MDEDSIKAQLGGLRFCTRDFIEQCFREGLDPVLIGMAMVAAGTDLINAAAGPGIAHLVATGAQSRVDRSMVAPDGKPH